MRRVGSGRTTRPLGVAVFTGTVLVPRGDSSALADDVARLAADRPRRELLGRAGRALVVAQHTWQHRARTILNAVAELAPAGARA